MREAPALWDFRLSDVTQIGETKQLVHIFGEYFLGVLFIFVEVHVRNVAP